MMAKYRKKPVVIEAVRWFGNEFGGYNLAGQYANERIGVDMYGVEHTATECGVQTLEGFMRVRHGDWIITGVKGEKYPCKPDIFAMTYEAVE